jgi:hypothetical protein
MPVTVWCVDTPSCPPYDEFVRAQAGQSLYHTLAWRDALAREGHGEPVYLMALAGEEVVGVLPLVEQSYGPGRARLTSLPATPCAGLLARDVAAATALLERATNYAKERGAAPPTCRTFGPARLCPPGARREWGRLPLTSVTEDCQGAETAPPPGEARMGGVLLAGTSAGPTGLDAILRNLAAAGGHPGHYTLRDAAGAAVGTAVWITRGTTAYVLRYEVAESVALVRQLLAQLVERWRREGAEQVDLGLPPQELGWVRQMLELPEAAVSMVVPLATTLAVQ